MSIDRTASSASAGSTRSNLIAVPTIPVLERIADWQGRALPEGAIVTVLAQDPQASVRLPSQLQAELEEALVEADREEGISADELFARIKKQG